MNATPSRFLRRGLIVWALAWFATFGLVQADDAGVSRLVEWAGRVEISRTNAAFTAAGTNVLLVVGDRIRTGPASRATLQLSDRSVVRIGADTVLEIRTPAQAAGTRRFDLKSGLPQRDP